jgi:hypothetical protein
MNPGSRAAHPRRREQTRFIVCERRRSRRVLDVRAALQEEMRNTLFRSVSSDEDGGNPANIAASGASNQTPDRAPPC